MTTISTDIAPTPEQQEIARRQLLAARLAFRESAAAHEHAKEELQRAHRRLASLDAARII